MQKIPRLFSLMVAIGALGLAAWRVVGAWRGVRGGKREGRANSTPGGALVQSPRLVLLMAAVGALGLAAWRLMGAWRGVGGGKRTG